MNMAVADLQFIFISGPKWHAIVLSIGDGGIVTFLFKIEF